MDDIRYTTGLPEHQRLPAATIYDAAFGEKFRLAIPNADDRLEMIRRGLTLDYAIGALDGDQLLGIAGFTTAEGSLTGGISYQGLADQLGRLRGTRAALVLSVYERDEMPDELLMDGIAVRSDARGLGIGSRLLREIIELAVHDGYQQVRLDVIDTNPGARALYLRTGFAVVEEKRYSLLKPLLGFGGHTTMAYQIRRQAAGGDAAARPDSGQPDH